ncbi:hypothetical protein KZX06_08705 [Micrococcus sp. EYE_162]|nr:hypothetical protein [Micrococcus sp. EYE_212]MCK6172108.1 hypothetical protein [Micrococcus sp. EYE_162]
MTAYEELGMSAQARIETTLHPVSPYEAVPPRALEPRTPLSVVPAPLPRSGPGLVVFCVSLLVAALAAVLVLNITLSNRQYALLELRAEQQTLMQTNERLAEQVGYLEAPQNLAARADALGMVPPAGTAALDASTGEFSGEAVGAGTGSVSAAFVAPPAGADAAGPADAEGRIPAPRTGAGAADPAAAAPASGEPSAPAAGQPGPAVD